MAIESQSPANMHKIKKQYFQKWLSYRDILLLYDLTATELVKLTVRINEIHHLHKITEVSNFTLLDDLGMFKSLSCLTLLVYKIPKPTANIRKLQHRPVDRHSAHPLATFRGLMKGEVICYVGCLYSNETDSIIHHEFQR